jgi:quinoprotein glucose dehydrogenase
MRLFIALLAGTLMSVAMVQSQAPQQPPAAASGDWPTFRHDNAGTGYSPLTDINASNVSRLAQAWTYHLQGAPAASAPTGRGGGAVNSEATPIVVRGVMYVPAANRVVALEPETGKEIWEAPVSGGAPSRRGVAYWAGEGNMAPRIVFTSGRRLIALDAKTGNVVQSFGTNGEVDLVTPYNSVPFIYQHVVVVGANTPPGAIGGIGNPRAYDVRTGAKLWEFSAVPQPGETGHDTWDGDSWKDRLGVNAWPFYFTMDEQRGLLYVPLASPVPGDYGGDRKGANLFGNSVVAVDIATGKYRWHFQTIHHDIWDADPPAPPGLFDIVKDGQTIPALALTTKSGYMYILNRETGQPVFGVEERAVAKSDVPGEAVFPTQPFPVKPPPIARNEFKPDDLVTAADTTPEHAAACKELVEKNGIYNAGPFTPWAYRGNGAAKTALVFPGGLGGANWGGTAYDPNSHYVFTATQDAGALGWMDTARPGRGGQAPPVPFEKVMPQHEGGRGVFDVRVDGASWPCQRPPWGRLIAVNTITGDIAWQVPLGITEQLPAGKQNTGRPVLAGPIVTASGLIFIASTDDNRFRALDAKTARELWVTKLERRGNADPITYRGKDGRQYVAVVATDTVVAFALP